MPFILPKATVRFALANRHGWAVKRGNVFYKQQKGASNPTLIEVKDNAPSMLDNCSTLDGIISFQEWERLADGGLYWVIDLHNCVDASGQPHPTRWAIRKVESYELTI